jgi:hypothetical protein
MAGLGVIQQRVSLTSGEGCAPAETVDPCLFMPGFEELMPLHLPPSRDSQGWMEVK